MSRTQLSHGSSMSPESVRRLPDALQHAYTSAYADALSNVFLAALTITLVGLGCSLFLKNVPLRK